MSFVELLGRHRDGVVIVDGVIDGFVVIFNIGFVDIGVLMIGVVIVVLLAVAEDIALAVARLFFVGDGDTLVLLHVRRDGDLIDGDLRVVRLEDVVEIGCAGSEFGGSSCGVVDGSRAEGSTVVDTAGGRRCG